MEDSGARHGPPAELPLSVDKQLLYGMLQGISSSFPSNFIIACAGLDSAKDSHGAAYHMGALEQALALNVEGDTDPGLGDQTQVFGIRRPTLNIFPSWPMRFEDCPKATSQSAKSTDSGLIRKRVSCKADTQLEFESPATSAQTEPAKLIDMASNICRAGTSNELGKDVKVQNRRGPTSSSEQEGSKILDAKTLRRLAQNREAARKSRLRKKAYVQQLESSRIKLNQIEQDLQRARSQGIFIGGASGLVLNDQGHPAAGGLVNGGISSGAAVFDMEYARWLEENHRYMSDLRAALQAHLPDNDLRMLLDNCFAHYDDKFRLKGTAVKADVFHIVSGMWKTPAERCFMWMGGFRPSELLKILVPQLEPLTEQQFLGICNLQQSSHQAEDALSQGMEALQQSLSDTIAAGSLSPPYNVTNYMGQMAIAMGQLSNLEGFVRQADNLRQQTLQQLCRILTTRQAAKCLLAIGEYFNRLRALSSLWAARPRDDRRLVDGVSGSTPVASNESVQYFSTL